MPLSKDAWRLKANAMAGMFSFQSFYVLYDNFLKDGDNY